MNLPKQVVEAGRKAEEDLKVLRGENEGDPTPPEGNTGDPGDPPPPDPTAAPPATPEPGESGEPIDWKDEHAKLTQKFNVLRGKFDAENPRLKQENKELRDELDALKRDVAQMQTGNPPNDPEGGAPLDDVPEGIQEMYGEDLLKFIDARAALIAKRESANAVKPVADQFTVMQNDTIDTRRQKFFGAIAEAHPDWEQVNQLDAWLTFCGEYLPELGVERQEILNRATQELNSGPVIAQMNAFKAKHGKGEQTALSHKEVPSDTGGTPPPSENESAPRIKESEIAKFYKDMANGKFRGREKEAKRLEDRIRAANEANSIIMDVTGSRGPVFGD